MPMADMWFRVRPDGSLEWHPDLLPILFGAECKPLIRLTLEVLAQLACAINATLIILITYYIDNRSSDDESLPEWMYIYGIVYTEDGFSVHAHFPFYSYGNGWRFASTTVTEKFIRIWQTEAPINRLKSLPILFEMIQHGLTVLEHLKEWKNGEAVLAALAIDS